MKINPMNTMSFQAKVKTTDSKFLDSTAGKATLLSAGMLSGAGVMKTGTLIPCLITTSAGGVGTIYSAVNPNETSSQVLSTQDPTNAIEENNGTEEK